MTNWWALVTTYLRRDRWMLVAWVVGAVLLFPATAAGVDSLYPTQADYDAAAASESGNAAFIAMAGPPRALDTLGGQTAWQTTAYGAIIVALMSMFLVGRHTRAHEESGRDELLRAGPVGRLASTAAAFTIAAAANLLIGILVSASLAGYGLAVADSQGMGLGLAACGLLFTGTSLVAMQLTVGVRAAYGIAGSFLGACFALRAVGDVGNGVASWLSPIGWYQAMHQYSGLRWWPMLLLLAGAAVATSAAVVLHGRRDYGAGIVAARPAPERASPRLAGSLGLAIRLQRGLVLGWAAGLLLLGLAYGAIGDDVQEVIGTSTTTTEILVQGGGDLVTSFFATSILTAALVAGGFAISSALHPRREEDDGRLEALLATALPRSRWLAHQVALTVGGTLLVLVAAGTGFGVGYLSVTGDASTAWSFAWPILTYAPPVLLLSAVARLLFGLAPRWSTLAWVPLAFVLVVMVFGDLFHLPDWVQGLSPFEHLSLAPAEAVSWPAVAVIGLLAAAVSAAGQVAFVRRDVRG